jgi:hypothetical protein
MLYKNIILKIIVISFIVVSPVIFFLVSKDFDYHTFIYCTSIVSICFWFLIILEDKANQLLQLKNFLLFPVSVNNSIRKIISHFFITRKYYILIIINVMTLIIFRISFFFITSFFLQIVFTILSAFVIREIFIKYNIRNHIGIIPGLSLLVVILLLKFDKLEYIVLNPFTSLFCIPLNFQISGNYFVSFILYLCLLILFPVMFLITKMILRYGYNPSNK